MLLIVRPGADVFQGAALFALARRVFYAIYQIMTRMLAGEDPRVLLFYPALVGTRDDDGRCCPASTWPLECRGPHVALIVVAGMLGTFGHFLFILAFRPRRLRR